MSASSSAPPSRGRESSSCAATCPAVRGYRPWSATALKCRGGPCSARRGDGGDGRARHGGPGRHERRQLRGLGRSARNARLRRLGQGVRRGDRAGGNRRAGRGQRELFVVREVVRLGGEDCWIEARPAAGGKTIIHYDLDYGSGNPIGRQSLEVTLAPRFFQFSLAPSRTFMLAARGGRLAGPRHGPADHVQRLADLRQPTARSATRCGSPTNASGTRYSTWWATWPWPAATWPDASPPTAAGIASTPSWCGRCSPVAVP